MHIYIYIQVSMFMCTNKHNKAISTVIQAHQTSKLYPHMYAYTSTQEISACTEGVEKVATHLSETISITLVTKCPKACIYQQQIALHL